MTSFGVLSLRIVGSWGRLALWMGGPEDCHPFHLLRPWYRPCARQFGHVYSTKSIIINATSMVMVLFSNVLTTLLFCFLFERLLSPPPFFPTQLNPDGVLGGSTRGQVQRLTSSYELVSRCSRLSSKVKFNDYRCCNNAKPQRVVHI